GGANLPSLPLRPWGDHGGPLPGKEAVEDPPDRAVRIADTAPVVEFLDHFDRKIGAREDPRDLVVFARTDADINASGLKADETRNRQPALSDLNPDARLRLRGAADGEPQARKRQ